MGRFAFPLYEDEDFSLDLEATVFLYRECDKGTTCLDLDETSPDMGKYFLHFRCIQRDDETANPQL